MWLIDTHTLALKRFQDDRKAVGRYAILSHRWQHEEVLFGDLAIGRNVEVPAATKLKYGFAKIEESCRLARHDGYPYLWSDTCCINKESSAELSEAIASMWRWYSDAAICYAYLCDVVYDADRVEDLRNDPDRYSSEILRVLRLSVWFQRGWTLQELIAPSKVRFFGQNWQPIGFKSEMVKILERITGIGVNALRSRDMVSSYCVAKRMAWAAKRQTTRIEDEAYCLLGLFGVNMPMMYGEGQRAFLRLQEEIVRSSTDHSIFAWSPSKESGEHHLSALFAPNSRCFTGLRLHKKTIEDLADDEAYELTNRGLRISLPVHVDGDHLLAMLNCVSNRLHDRNEVVVLRLKKHERQNQLAPKQNSRIVCEIERSYTHRNWYSRSTLEPLQWMDLTILRHGLTSEVKVEFKISPKLESDVYISTVISEDSMVLVNPTGKPLSAGHIMVNVTNGSELHAMCLSVGQCLRQANSFATFRLHWCTAPISEHQLLLQHPSTIASSDGILLGYIGLVARAILCSNDDLRYYWLVCIERIGDAVFSPRNEAYPVVLAGRREGTSAKAERKCRRQIARAKAREARQTQDIDDVSPDLDTERKSPLSFPAEGV